MIALNNDDALNNKCDATLWDWDLESATKHLDPSRGLMLVVEASD